MFSPRQHQPMSPDLNFRGPLHPHAYVHHNGQVWQHSGLRQAAPQVRPTARSFWAMQVANPPETSQPSTPRSSKNIPQGNKALAEPTQQQGQQAARTGATGPLSSSHKRAAQRALHQTLQGAKVTAAQVEESLRCAVQTLPTLPTKSNEKHSPPALLTQSKSASVQCAAGPSASIPKLDISRAVHVKNNDGRDETDVQKNDVGNCIDDSSSTASTCASTGAGACQGYTAEKDPDPSPLPIEADSTCCPPAWKVKQPKGPGNALCSPPPPRIFTDSLFDVFCMTPTNSTTPGPSPMPSVSDTIETVRIEKQTIISRLAKSQLINDNGTYGFSLAKNNIVVDIRPGSYAENRLEIGDELLSVQGTSVMGLTPQDICQLLQGTGGIGLSRTVLVLRAGEEVHVELIRQDVDGLEMIAKIHDVICKSRDLRGHALNGTLMDLIWDCVRELQNKNAQREVRQDISSRCKLHQYS
jgi:hypothetical protein